VLGLLVVWSVVALWSMAQPSSASTAVDPATNASSCRGFEVRQDLGAIVVNWSTVESGLTRTATHSSASNGNSALAPA